MSTLASAAATAALRSATTSARVPTSMRSRSACATAFAAFASLSFVNSSGLSIDDKHLSGRDVVAAGNRAFAHPAVDARRNVDARRICLALYKQRLRLHEVP